MNAPARYLAIRLATAHTDAQSDAPAHVAACRALTFTVPCSVRQLPRASLIRC